MICDFLSRPAQPSHQHHTTHHTYTHPQATFHNITRIMDCVGCEKCKMWAKLQLLGIATSLKILFSAEDCGGRAGDMSGEGGGEARGGGGERLGAVIGPSLW